LILFNGLLQLIGVTSIFPFFALASNPERLRSTSFGHWFLQFLPPVSSNNLLVIAGVFSIVMMVLAGVGSVASEVIRTRYAFGFCHWLRRQLFESYAARPYEFFLKHNTVQLNQKFSDVYSFISNVLLPLGEIITRAVMVLLLVGVVLLVQPWIALGAVLLLGGFYLVVYLLVRPKTREIGEGLKYNHGWFGKNTFQFLHGIKTVFVHGKSRQFMDKALVNSEAIGRYQSRIPIYSNGPRYLIEPIAFGGLVGIVVVMALQGRPFSDILPNLAVIGAASMRLLPALQLLYSQVVTVSANSYTLGQLEEELLQIESETGVIERNPSEGHTRMIFSREIRLENISFWYPEQESPVLQDFNLVIRKNESVGIAGPSGSGKSTLVDLILGLHRPGRGRILVDDTVLVRGNINAWRGIIGYVPQEIYLLDDSISANIAFGIPPQEVDQQALIEAAQGAQILDFIEKDLLEAFSTRVGERGVRLSGGQRQRIGLARALYHRPQVLILDEATSALDNQTELAVMETIHKLQGTLTIITIAHRLSTIERCDRVIYLNKVS
jgi:ATP-binding cassette subfamily C protein